jgi:hypothetical protein
MKKLADAMCNLSILIYWIFWVIFLCIFGTIGKSLLFTIGAVVIYMIITEIIHIIAYGYGFMTNITK